MMHLLDRFLAALDVGVAVLTSCDVRHGWELAFNSSRAASLHYCLSGAGVLVIENRTEILIKQHSFVLLPPKLAYSFKSDRSTPGLGGFVHHHRFYAPSFEESVPNIQAGDGEKALLTACGEIRLTCGWAADMFARLMNPIIEQFDEANSLADQFVLLLAEAARPRIGTRALTEALLKQCLVMLLRRQLEGGASPVPWITALTDRRLGAALMVLLERSSERLTVEALADVAGMSRSAFADQFVMLFGQTPMKMLREVRLRRASDLLIMTKLPIEQVARDVGLPGRSNFSRAFRDLYGTDPSAFRATFSNGG